MIEAILAFLFGLIIGSFLNVCIHRWPRNRSVVRPRSHCVRCRKMIPWYDNIPVVSWLALGGRCRFCKARISVRYPLMELLTAALFFYAVYTRGVTPSAGKLCVMGGMCLALVFCDIEKRILPDEFTIGGALIGIVFSLLVAVPDHLAHVLLWVLGIEWPERALSLAESILGATIPAAFLWLGGWLYWKIRHREGLGLGDVKLIAMVGSFLGMYGSLVTLVGGSIAGSLIGLTYIKLAGKDTASYELPFGTFLAAMALIVAIFEKQLLAW